LAPKWIARAIARVCRWPPESVPTAWLGSAMSMPILCISPRVIASMVFMSKSPRTGGPRWISRPREKGRVALVSGFDGGSWSTVPLPAVDARVLRVAKGDRPA